MVELHGESVEVVKLDGNRRRRITKVAKERHLMLLEEGLTNSEAAQQLGLTGSRMRAEAKRDPEFGAAVEKALERGLPGLQDRIRSMYAMRALDPEGPPQLLHNYAVVHLPEFESFRKMKLEGPLDLRALPTIDPALYSDDELRMLKELLERRPPEGP